MERPALCWFFLYSKKDASRHLLIYTNKLLRSHYVVTPSISISVAAVSICSTSVCVSSVVISRIVYFGCLYIHIYSVRCVISFSRRISK